MKRALLVAAVVAGLTGLTGCYDPHAQESRIVRELEAAGSGDISTYSVQGLAQWLSLRPTLMAHVAGECAALEKTTTANWQTSAEGTVCLVAERLAPPPPMIADQQKW